MHPALDIVTGDAALPREVDTVVIGGGIIGVCTALSLVERGQKVALCEKGVIGAEQSGRNWGWVRRMGRDLAEFPLGVLSLELWAGMNARVGGETGFTRSGIVYAAETPAELAVIEGYKRDADQFGIGAEMLGPEGYARHMPGACGTVLGAIYTADDGRAEPGLATPAMARALMRLGGHVLTRCAIRGIETSGGALSGVITERGVIRARAAVLAGGAWSRLFAGNLGIGLPVLKVKGSVLRTAPLEGGPRHALGNGHFGVRRRRDGGYTIASRSGSQAQITPDSFLLFRHYLPTMWENRGEYRLEFGESFWQEAAQPRRWRMDEVTPFEKTRILNPTPSRRLLAAAQAELIRRFPVFAGMREVERWGGIIDATPDAVPIIGPSSIPGLMLATGFSGHGFGIGPGAGQLAADLVLGAPPSVDPAPFALSRFRRVWAPGKAPATAA